MKRGDHAAPMRHANLTLQCYPLALLLCITVGGCVTEYSRAGDGVVVDRSETFSTPSAKRITIVLAKGRPLRVATNAPLFNGLQPGATESEATSRLGQPTEISVDVQGDRWARWRVDGGHLEVGQMARGSRDPVRQQWTVRFKPVSGEIREILTEPVAKRLTNELMLREAVVISPHEKRQLWLTIARGQVTDVYFLPVVESPSSRERIR